MTTITISLPAQIAKQVDHAAKIQGFATRSEFVRSLLRKYFATDDIAFEQFTTSPLDEIKLELARTGKYNQEFIESVTKGLAKSSPYAR